MHPGTANQRQNHFYFAAAISAPKIKSEVPYSLLHISIILISTKKMLREPVFFQMFMSYPDHDTFKFALRVFLQVLRSFTTVHSKSVQHVKRKLQFVPVYRYVCINHPLLPKEVVTDLKWFSFLFRRNDASGLL